ncbi:hypothetical protein D9M70_503560 [compost metagenome]
MPANHLQRLLQVADEIGPEHFMAIDRRLPGLPESLDVQSIDVHPHLVDVVATLLLVQAVEQHPLLHRRQRVDIGDLRRGNRQTVQLRLAQSGQREVRRRHSTVLLPAAMLDQRLEFLGIVVGQAQDRPLVEQFPAEGPVQAQLAVVHLPVEAEQAAQRRLLALSRATAFLRRHEQTGFAIEAAIELTQVVENDLALRQSLQRLPRLGTAQVAQQAVADPLVRHRPQLLLDRLDRCRQLRLRA